MLALIANTALNPSNLALVSMGVGFLLPHAIAVVNQRRWSEQTRSLVAAGCCLAAAAATAWAKGKLDLQHLSESALLIFTVARASYAGLWRPAGAVDAVEARTELGGEQVGVWERPAVVDHVHDGDTIVVAIDLGKIARKRVRFLGTRRRRDDPSVVRDLGWHIYQQLDGHLILKSAVRIQGLAAPETSTAAGKASAAFAKALLAPGDAVEVVSLELYGSFEKYGRVLATVKLADGRDFAEVMIAAGHAVAWDGKGKQPAA